MRQHLLNLCRTVQKTYEKKIKCSIINKTRKAENALINYSNKPLENLKYHTVSLFSSVYRIAHGLQIQQLVLCAIDLHSEMAKVFVLSAHHEHHIHRIISGHLSSPSPRGTVPYMAC